MPSKSASSGPTLVLAAIAAAMLQAVLYDRPTQPVFEWIHFAVAVTLAIVIRRTERIENEALRNRVGAVCFLCLMALPFLGDVVQRSISDWGRPFEIQMVLGLRNMMFGLAASKSDTRKLSYASLASCFVALYSLLWLMNRWTIGLIFVYTIMGMWWLATAYWSRLSDCFVSRTERSIPWKPVFGTTLVGLAFLGLLIPLATGNAYTTAIDGFVPSSGGTKWEDEHAFGGVGDGPQMVSAQDDASSFGPVESELFLESEMPSLYDCFNEFSQPPEGKKKKKRVRAIPLAPSQMKENHSRKGVTQKPGREFNAVRKRKNRPSPKAEDLPSPELLQISGRVPVHLGLYTYDLWDGHTLSSSNRCDPFSLFLESRAGVKNWVRVSGLIEDDVLTYHDQHQIRFINLQSARVPSTPGLTAVHINQIHAANLFTTTQDGVLALDMDSIPQLSVIHVESLRRRRTKVPFPVRTGSQLVDQPNPFNEIAKEWTAEFKGGWPQVEAICDRLREEYELDPEAMVPEDVDDAALHFLRESKRGPDYLFAASTAMMLRSLGYEARVVSGFYANPENYDRQARLTSVFSSDAHFWVEILVTSVDRQDPSFAIARRHWVAIDPSPGYEVLFAPESVWSRMMASCAEVWRTMGRHPVALSAVFAFCLVSWLWRAAICDLAITNWWRVRFRLGDTHVRIIATLRLVERRARLYGQPQATAVSLGRWNLLFDGSATAWKPFVDVANWALYGEGCLPNQSQLDISALCSEVALLPLRSGWTKANAMARQQEQSI